MLGEILRTYPSAPKINDLAVAYSSHSSDPSLTPRPLGDDLFDHFDDTPSPGLVADSSTNPGTVSTPDRDHPRTGHTYSSPQIPNLTTEELIRPGVWREISGGDTTFHQTPGWKWEGDMDNPDQAWAISTS